MAKSIKLTKISLFEILSMAVEALWSNRLRTGLTMLGVIIGITSVIAVTSVGQGIQKATELQIQALGSNVMLVLAGFARTGGSVRVLGLHQLSLGKMHEQ